MSFRVGAGAENRVATVEADFVDLGESWKLTVRSPQKLAKYIAAKGSITINGVPGSYVFPAGNCQGPLNPLGSVKLALETPEGVHLHDTPARSLFERRRRTFSHGCIRMEHPERLVGYLFPGWSPDSVAAAMASRKETFVPLPAPIAVHLVYRTAWVEHDGMVAFREDPYRLDRR